MKPRHLLTLLLSIFFVLGCHDSNITGGDNGGGEPKVTAEEQENQRVNKWVYSKYAEKYLWAGSMPNALLEEQKQKPNEYFDGKLRFRTTFIDDYSKDYFGDRFSRVEKKDVTTRVPLFGDDTHVLGFGFKVVSFVDGTPEGGIDYNVVTVVTPGSPAAKAGLKRGYCFDAINGKDLGNLYTNNPGDYYQVLARENSIKLRVFYPERKDVVIDKNVYEDTPIHYSAIYSLQESDIKTGYVVYNHFTGGDTGSGRIFNNQLKDLFTEFTNAGVKNIIVDLRSNGGGEVSTARYVASLLAPHRFLGKTFAYFEEKKSFGNPDKFAAYSLLAAEGNEIAGANPNATRLYFLVNNYSASASELVVHSLKALMANDVVVIGERTYGKNVGGITHEEKGYDWSLNIITLRVYDSKKFSGYERGLEPDIPIKDMSMFYDRDLFPNIIKVYPGEIGDTEKDPMLNKALSMIYSIESTRTEDIPVRSSQFVLQAAGETPQMMIDDREEVEEE